MILIALAIFMIGSVCCALAPNIELLTAARVLQGFGGGGLMTLSQALVGETVPPRERGRYQGYLAAVAVSSNTFGPVAGGYLTQAFGWRSIFLINVPLGLVAGLLVLRLAIQPGDRRRTTFDAPGLLLFIMFVGPVILALEQVQRMEASALPMIGGSGSVRITSLAVLVWQEMHSNSPLIPPVLFREAVSLAQRWPGCLSRRRAGLIGYVLADLSACGARDFAGRDRAVVVATDIRHRS